MLPPQRQGLPAAPAGQGQEAGGCQCGGPKATRLSRACLPGCLARTGQSRSCQPGAQRGILGVGQAPLPPTICVAHDALHGVIRAHPLADGIGEDGPQQTHGAAGCPFATADVGQPALLAGGLARLRSALGNLVHEGFYIFPSDGWHLHGAQDRLDVGSDAAAVRQDSAGLLRAAAPRQQSAGFSIF